MNSPGGGGGGVREVGTVTGGMALMNFDEKTRPYTRQDLVAFLMDYEKNLTHEELRLCQVGIAGTAVGMPVAGYLGYRLSGRLAWHRVQRVLPFSWATRVGRCCLSLSAATMPYILIQTWWVSQVMALDASSNLAFHVKRMMVTQRNGMMFQRTATREVTRDEQERLSREATDHVLSNRMANRPQQQGGGGGSGGGMDVNLALGQQVMVPIAQSGYKPLPPKQ